MVQHCEDTPERVRRLELYRLDKIRLALDSKKGDPRVADTLIRISERVAKLHGLDAPQKIEASGPNDGPIQTEEQRPDFGKLTLQELFLYKALLQKALGAENWDKEIHEQANEPFYDPERGIYCQATLLLAVSRMLQP